MDMEESLIQSSPLSAVEQGLQLGGGLGLQAFQRVHFQLQRRFTAVPCE